VHGFDDREENNKAICTHTKIKKDVPFAVLVLKKVKTKRSCKRAGNEFLFQNKAMMNIEVLNAYEAKIVTACPHCFNTLKK
jgi:Fe-S oxidoreductase